MRTIRLYIAQQHPQPFVSGESLQLDDNATHYLLTVLRAKAGYKVDIFNGHGASATGIISNVQKRSAAITIQTITEISCESPLHIHLGIGISKGDRFEWVLQKATELGVTEITPLWCEHSQVKLDNERIEKKHRHWQQIIISACEQSGRNTLPVLHQACDSHEWIKSVNAERKFTLDPRAELSLDKQTKPASVALLIGPEGGLNESETTAAAEEQFIGLQLGPRILRTETAPLAALSILQFVWGDLG
jgi:16S rRNA (uracil1498-N3)-methyltransferase